MYHILLIHLPMNTCIVSFILTIDSSSDLSMLAAFLPQNCWSYYSSKIILSSVLCWLCLRIIPFDKNLYFIFSEIITHCTVFIVESGNVEYNYLQVTSQKRLQSRLWKNTGDSKVSWKMRVHLFSNSLIFKPSLLSL